MLAQRTVLAVDDEPANQRAVRRALADDCRLLTAGSGADALALMEHEPVALVISDQRMPGMSGAEFLAETIRRHPHVVRVVLTGYPDVDSLLEAINRNHVYHFLGKPWDPRELRQVVRRGLDAFAAAAERIQLMAELERACARAERESAQKSRLLALTAHELGTPLHILVNAMELLRETDLPVAAAPWIDAAERATTWLMRAIAQLHRAATLRTRPILLRREPVAIAALAAAALALVRSAASTRTLDLAVAASDASLTLCADRRWLGHALDGLLSNAVRFTPDGGAVRIGWAVDEGHATVSVSDTGIGIPAEHLGEIFEPFSAAGGDPLLHGSGRLAFGARGLGLGLAMVRSIAVAHGGRVDVESIVGVGSRFVLRLPLGPPPGASE